MIKTENLTKQFDTTTALDCLSTTIEEGRIYGLVGSNGAGNPPCCGCWQASTAPPPAAWR